MSHPSVKPRAIGTLTPSSDNDVYKIASKSLKALNPPLHISPADLGKFFELLELPCRRLVRVDLISQEQLRQHVQKEGVDHDWTAVQVADPEPELDSSGEEGEKINDSEIPKEESPIKIHSVPSKGPITALLQSKGINFPAEKLARLMHILATPPKIFVQKGLISAESLNVPKEEDILNEIHFYKRLTQRQRQDKSRASVDGPAPHVTNVHHHYYYMDSTGWIDDNGSDGMFPPHRRGGPGGHRVRTAPAPPLPPHFAHHEYEFGHGPPPLHHHSHHNARFGRPHRGHFGKHGYATDH